MGASTQFNPDASKATKPYQYVSDCTDELAIAGVTSLKDRVVQFYVASEVS